MWRLCKNPLWHFTMMILKEKPDKDWKKLKKLNKKQIKEKAHGSKRDQPQQKLPSKLPKLSSSQVL